VASEFQSGGLGTVLLDLAFLEAANRGYREVSLTVTDLNYGARRLYERLGFETFRIFGAFVWTHA
jgi:ribosomal protein S18 acetylase RimI-like enzyme